MSLQSTIFVLLFGIEEDDNVLSYLLSNADLCCCKDCIFKDEEPWIKGYFNDSSYFNIELCFQRNGVAATYASSLANKILGVIRRKYYSPDYAPSFFDSNRFSKLRIVKHQVPWVVCKRKLIELSYEVFSKSELRKFQQLTGLELIHDE